jgi:Uncharacterized protein conserved in bacteria (DUF2252)
MRKPPSSVSKGFTIAARNNGFKRADARAAALSAANAYREAMARFAEMRTMDIWYARISAQDVIDAINPKAGSLKGADRKRAKTVHKAARKSAANARTRDSLIRSQLTTTSAQRRRSVPTCSLGSDADLVPPPHHQLDALGASGSIATSELVRQRPADPKHVRGGLDARDFRGMEATSRKHTEKRRWAGLLPVVEPGVDPGTFRFSGGRSAD